MIVCFECKRAASKVVSIDLFLIYLLCTWVTCLPVHSRCTGAFMCLGEVTFLGLFVLSVSEQLQKL